ncbi:hypothetical protein CRG98_029625 [Punica granatum]|uniref:Uncharacterized protein n=1 Tax=Punica granatum TaxID=22663 RepID=A0A2I0J195_PUNGR|nr:hypothetical protein CRG98_029625 [Punica granatum]
MTAWQTTVIEHPYFPEHPTQDERDFQATEENILRFYRWGPSENDDFTDSPPVESSTSSGAPVPDMAIQAELANLRAERDRLRREHAFTALGSGPTSSSGPASGSNHAFTASGFGPASGSGPAFTASGFGPAFRFWPRIGLRPHFWASAPHRASTPLLSFGLLSGINPAFTAFGPRPSIYRFWAPAQHLLHSGFDTSYLLLSGSSEIQNRLGFKFIQGILRGASLILSLQRPEVTAPQAEHDPTLDRRRYQHDHATDQEWISSTSVVVAD